MAADLMKVSVTHDDGTSDTYVVKPATIVAFERQFNVGLGTLKEAGRMEYVYWLAWDSERRSGKITKPFDGWLDEVADVDVSDDVAPLPSAGATPAA
jgi:hypothetical protein